MEPTVEVKKVPYKVVDKLPDVAVKNEVVLNKADGFFYIGEENNKEDKQ